MRELEKIPTENRYNDLAEKYQESNEKPDKQYSILPTVLKAAGELKNKTVLDLGSGGGFFARELAKKGASKVIGIDNSEKQIELARRQPEENVEYRLGDIFTDDLPKADVIVAPFVVNYPKTVDELKDFTEKLYASLNENGRVIMVVDLPTSADLKKFGAIKTLLGEAKDETPIKIDLYDGDKFICTLHATYFEKDTIETKMKEIGFTNIQWHQPVVSEQGREKYGDDFWRGYVEQPELGYVTAEKM